SAINNVLTQFSFPQVTYETDVNPTQRAQRTFTFKSELHKPTGKQYVVLTDITTPASLTALQRLAQLHQGTVIQVEDLRQLVNDVNARKQLEATLQQQHTAYVAIAPKYVNYSEKVVLALWQVLADLGNGRINVYPGFLIAPNEQAFVNLVNNNI